MNPFNSVADVRKFIVDLDSEKCPVAKRARELREEERERVRKAREAHAQQQQAANIFAKLGTPSISASTTT
ncbi:MAG TPA: hypothetical protein VKE42_13045 [Candidatus Cybelea sp.]|nr:hypothetical protein [Candidatus Cybelea sp.]